MVTPYNWAEISVRPGAGTSLSATAFDEPFGISQIPSVTVIFSQLHYQFSLCRAMV